MRFFIVRKSRMTSGTVDLDIIVQKKNSLISMEKLRALSEYFPDRGGFRPHLVEDIVCPARPTYRPIIIIQH